MRIQILSDQHIDVGRNFGYVVNRMVPRADVLVIAGDFCAHRPMRENFIRDRLLPKWKTIIMVPGNHDLWNCSFDDPFFGSAEKVFEHSNGNKCYYVNNKIVEVDNVCFICSTLWSHIGAVNSFQIQRSLGDYAEIKGYTIEKNNEYHLINKAFLSESVSSLVNDSRKKVIVTHHIPSFNLVSPRWKNQVLNEAFAADMDSFIMMYSDYISCWIHGHSHDFLDTYLGGIHFVRNPMGYPKERNGDMDLVINV